MMELPEQIPKTESGVWRKVQEYVERGDFSNGQQHNSTLKSENGLSTTKISTNNNSASKQCVEVQTLKEVDATPMTETEVWQRVYNHVHGDN